MVSKIKAGQFQTKGTPEELSQEDGAPQVEDVPHMFTLHECVAEVLKDDRASCSVRGLIF